MIVYPGGREVCDTRTAEGKRELYEYNFADLDAYAQAAMAPLAERGITWSFPFSEANGQITVSCILRYGLFEATPTTMSAPPDATGGKNAIQAKASTISYLERYTFCGATGLTAAMPDRDGHSATEGAETISQEVGADWVASIEEAQTPAEAMERWTAATNAAKHINDYRAMTIFTEARDKRLKELKRGSR